MEQVIKVGMVGLDTSHCPAFAGTLNNPGHETHVADAAAGQPGAERVDGQTVRLYGEDILEIIYR